MALSSCFYYSNYPNTMQMLTCSEVHTYLFYSKCIDCSVFPVKSYCLQRFWHGRVRQDVLVCHQSHIMEELKALCSGVAKGGHVPIQLQVE